MQDSDKPSSKEDFNRAGMRIYGIVSGVTFSICAGVFCLAMAVKADSGNWWYVGAGVALLGAIGGAYETYRLARASQPETDKPQDRHDPKP